MSEEEAEKVLKRSDLVGFLGDPLFSLVFMI